MLSVGIMTQCVSIRGKSKPEERCPNRARVGTEWCGIHSTSQTRWSAPVVAGPHTIQHIEAGEAYRPPYKALLKPLKSHTERPEYDIRVGFIAATTISRAWHRHLARRAGPLLYYREESNNPYDFFSGDPVTDIPLRDFVSYVATDRKGYVMDLKSAVSLLEHAAKNKEQPVNPFNREPLPAVFLKRVASRSGHGTSGWTALKPLTEEQKLTLAITDVFRLMEDQGYYTDPSWFVELSRTDLQRLYIEVADIWYHRASLTPVDQKRIVPGASRPFPMAVQAALIMQQKALRPLLLQTCKTLVSSAVETSDRRLGVMYFLGALSCVSPGAATAYPWLVEMFAPGCVTRVVGGHIQVLHASVLLH